ncbi:hypothetical protein INR49_010056 [Caranx melampygus]|nr:hypothetical protein INR49_010056 [Caranx melampygus]
MSDGDDEVTSSSHRDTVCPQRCRIPRIKGRERRQVRLRPRAENTAAQETPQNSGGGGQSVRFPGTSEEKKRLLPPNSAGQITGGGGRLRRSGRTHPGDGDAPR